MNSLAATPIAHQSGAEPVATSALETFQPPQRNNTSAPRISQHSSPAAQPSVLPPTPEVEHSSLEERRVTSGTRVLSFLSGTLLGGGIGFVARDCFTETTLIGSKVVPALKYVVSNVVSPVTMTTLISVAVMGICLIGYERAFTRIFDHLGRRRSF